MTRRPGGVLGLALAAIVAGTWLLVVGAVHVFHAADVAMVAYVAGSVVSVVALIAYGALTSPRVSDVVDAALSGSTEVLPVVDDSTQVIRRYADATELIPRQRLGSSK